ncbi:retrovirus-related pol polyprotein from transposon TNT 1-94 [Tanacetum coccineum]
MRLIQSLASKELVRNLPKLKFDQHLCDACKIGKQAHASHKAKNIVSMTRCLELLHMNLFSPSDVRSYGGNRYTLVIVDDYSRYTWTRFLKDKTEAFNQFEIFSKKIQNQLGCIIVSIGTDHGREFDNEMQFGEFCNANGITHNFSALRTPQSNGVVTPKIVKPTSSLINKLGKIEESLNVTFDETPPPFKISPLVDDDLDEEEAIKITEKKILENYIEDETLEINEIVNIKKSRNHPLENVIGNLNQRTLRLVAQGYNQQEGIGYDETYAPVARLESIRILLAYACALDFKLFQMDVKIAFLNGFINEEDHVLACLCHMLYCITRSERYNLAYFIAKRMKVLEDYYDLHDRVMYPLNAQQERKTRKDYGTKRGRHSTSSSSAFGQPSSSHLNDDDDDDGNDEGTSPSTQASSSNPSKKIKLTIISPRQLFFNISSDEDVTTTPSLITTSSSLSPPNAPSKTPSTKDISSTFGTTSSLFKSKPQSSPPNSNDTPSPQPSNPFLDNIMDAPS